MASDTKSSLPSPWAQADPVVPLMDRPPERKPSLTSSGMLAAAGGLATRKPSLTGTSMSLAAGLPVPTSSSRERKPSSTNQQQQQVLAAADAGTASPLSLRDRKPSLTLISHMVPTATATAPTTNAKNDIRHSLAAVGLVAFASSSRNLGPGLGPTPPATPPSSLGRSPSSRHIASSSSSSANTASTASTPTATSTTPKKQQQQQQQQLRAMKASRRSFSSTSSSLDQRIEIFFHVPAHKELQRLRVPRTLTLIGLQAMVQREFHLPFEDQRIYWHGDLLEGDEDLSFYDIHDACVLNIRVRKRFRPIGDVFTTIKTVKFVSTTKPDDYEIVEVVAPLPPTHILFKRLVFAITYLQRLDAMQFQKTNRRVWNQRVSFWADDSMTTSATNANSKSHQSHRASAVRTSRASSIVCTNDKSQQPTHPPDDASSLASPAVVQVASPPPPPPPPPSSFVMVHSGPERVSYVVSLSQTHSIPQRLQLVSDQRSQSDLRHIKKWLASIKFFASASLPDTAMHEVARACIYVKYRAGDFLFRQGEIGDHFYILISGCVSLAAYGNGFFATMTPGRCFGEISLFEGNGGLRTASANVNFAAPFAELAVLSGDIYRRVINPYKKAVLQHTEKAIYSVPQLRSLPDHIVTHVAYASKKLEARPGKLLVRHGEEVNVLVLLIQGEVKVSVTTKHTGGSGVFPVVSVVRAPAVFCQEGCLANTPTPAPWDIEALDHCTLVCLRIDTISIFLSPRQDIIRALYREHTQRLEDFQRRFGHHALPPRRYVTEPTANNNNGTDAVDASSSPPRRASAVKISKLRMLSSKLFAGSTQRLLHEPPPGQQQHNRHRRRRGATANIQFPKILLRRHEDGDQDDHHYTAATTRESNHDEANRRYESSSPRSPQPLSPLRPGTPPTCVDAQDTFLHNVLPFSGILSLRDQIRFCSPAALDLYDQDHQARTNALLRGLRNLPIEEVEMLVETSSGSSSSDEKARQQYHFIARPPPPTTNLPPPSSRSNSIEEPSTSKRRAIQTR